MLKIKKLQEQRHCEEIPGKPMPIGKRDDVALSYFQSAKVRLIIRKALSCPELG
jgi:hypothetical protein